MRTEKAEELSRQAISRAIDSLRRMLLEADRILQLILRQADVVVEGGRRISWSVFERARSRGTAEPDESTSFLEGRPRYRCLRKCTVEVSGGGLRAKMLLREGQL